MNEDTIRFILAVAAAGGVLLILDGRLPVTTFIVDTLVPFAVAVGIGLFILLVYDAVTGRQL